MKETASMVSNFYVRNLEMAFSCCGKMTNYIKQDSINVTKQGPYSQTFISFLNNEWAQ